uniref:Uncharacterized protein n=3 Tax=unclassified bacterial viruses TaxID=12333 RepID=A0AB39C4C0_9VIRU
MSSRLRIFRHTREQLRLPLSSVVPLFLLSGN